MMTLDEAIEHAEWAANNCEGECSDEHRQLAEWLRELRRARAEIDLLKTLRDGFKADVKKFKAENAKLRSERNHWHVEQVHAYGNWEDTHKYAVNLEAENDELRYKVHVLEGGNKGLQILNDSLKANNDNLRELVHDFALFAEDAVNKYGIELEAGHDVEAPPAEWKECLCELEMLVNRMRELGIEASNEHSRRAAARR